VVDPVDVYDIGFFKAGVFGDVAAKPAEGKGGLALAKSFTR